MATPIAHACAGALCVVLARSLGSAGKKLELTPGPLAAGAAIACSPDLDLLVSAILTGSPGKLHGGPTHSFAFALIVGALSFGLLRKSQNALGWAILVTLALTSHVLIDWFTGPKPGLHPSWGTAIAWPFDRTRHRLPVTLFRGVQHGGLSVLTNERNLRTTLTELLIYPPLTLLGLRLAGAKWFRRRMT
jgi:membrane-bound metal-dependent hydrolase YbcI (DUF457 family)